MMPPMDPYGGDGQWFSQPSNANVVHVIPTNDTIEHTLAEDCICGPATEMVVAEDGATGWVVTHPALDARP